MSQLSAQPLSPLDGRYQPQVAELSNLLSEAGLNRARIQVEIEWIIALSDAKIFGTEPLDDATKTRLRAIISAFGDEQIAELARTEAITRHDVKAVEYFMRDRLSELGLDQLLELTHFACTSEDINNLSYALIVRDAVNEVWLPALQDVVDRLKELAQEYRDAPMLSRTHGQPATPSTMGKELAVFVHRLNRQISRLKNQEYLGKINGATGTYAAHYVAAPDFDWFGFSEKFVSGLGLSWNPITTQIESHDWQVELYYNINHVNGILHNLATDIWTYISLGFFRQIPVAGATGSSTMPHKVNPIRFENAESNLELSTAILTSLAQTLVTTRMQRDLTDSSSQRNIGVGIGHSQLALNNLRRGLDEISLDRDLLLQDLDHNWEVLGEAIQTVIRAEVAAGTSNISDPYALLKELTRGKRIGQRDLIDFVNALDISDEAKGRLVALRPESYTGIAEKLVDRI
ncbi:MAG: adenylosuccinate lyase [Microbacteriaceae bacterium]